MLRRPHRLRLADRVDAPLQTVRGVLEFLGREDTLSGGPQDFIRAAVSAERSLRRTTEREAFGSTPAHEVRNPLSVIHRPYASSGS